MKTITAIFFFSFALLVIACNGTKNSQPENANNSNIIKPVDNFLAHTSYLTGMSRDDSGKLAKEIWNPTTRLESSGERYHYGVFIEFTDSIHYRKYYTASCGNDCFFSTVGKYRLTATDTLVMAIDSTRFWGECGDMPTLYGNGSEQIYNITTNPIDSVVQIIPLNKSAKETTGYY